MGAKPSQKRKPACFSTICSSPDHMFLILILHQVFLKFGTLETWDWVIQCSVTTLASTCVYGLPFPSSVDHILSDLSTMTRPSWVAPWAWLSFIELDKAVVLVWLDWVVFCEYSFSVFALWYPLATPTILLGFLLPWAWSISSQLFQQSAAIAPYLGWGVSQLLLIHVEVWQKTTNTIL